MARNRASLGGEGLGVSAVELTDTQQVVATLSPVDARGNAAKVDGVPAWETSDATIATVEAGPDDRSVTIRATGPTGSCRVSVTADADLGEGVVPIVGVLDITVIAGAAVTVDISVGAPSEQTNASRASA